ncbi:ROK family glucokinase [Alicyclobacillus mengziensis]|uniref:Glucokinase n=1 Tax=Alicyclobacillus mengziensis TaxID=2931921 RepID=A0A9X7W0J2_9BACL|nr:ROK family glucokinase [Alicyclobacillus mengziensis]QSO48190.1 ROK family glucokinase [Alicyclobacillus mengziensis]
MDAWFGIDIGGTSVKTALVDSQGTILVQQSFDTGDNRGENFIAVRIAQVLSELKDKLTKNGQDNLEVRGAGVGIPGFLDLDTGMVAEAVNLGWVNVPFQRMLEDQIGIPVSMENDANLAALGEAFAGAGAGHRVVLCATVGTGIGGGIVVDGVLHRGVNGMAGEIGHLVVQREGGVPCNCGHNGCLETLASATAIVRTAREQQAKGKLPQDTPIIEAKDVFDLADSGHATARQVIADAAEWLGYGLSLAAITLNPDVIVIGGGVSKANERFLVPMQRAFERYSLSRVSEVAHVRAATLSNDAGVIGAARLAQQQALA